MLEQDYSLHRLGWKAFQDLCVAIVEERVRRPVQTFLPTNDAGRDGAFLGNWDGVGNSESTIQCKFTSKQDNNLTLSMLADELPKAKRLAQLGLAEDYIILTNHPVTGESELEIKKAFKNQGVGNCRVFHRDWILERIRESSRLRMMVPRLYGLTDLTGILDSRAYKQAQIILSEMGDNLKKLVVTEAHRNSVRALNEYGFVLLLGSPAAGKSTIGASIAIGAHDAWRCLTIKSTSPEHLEAHIDPDGGQFFWIDDAWGSTQYQRDRNEAWNQVFPLIHGALKKGSKFLMTSRNYIWRSACKDLKIQALPVLNRSQVVIDVHELSHEEKARILYNHVKLGDQSESFRDTVKDMLPDIARRSDFLPESARRFGSKILTQRLALNTKGIADFFARPKEFLQDTIESLAPECRGAIALVFMNGGVIRSPIPREMLEKAAEAFGASPVSVREQVEALNGSLLNLAQDDDGSYWTYRHPTINDAFAAYVAKSPELVEIYLQGARAETIAREVLCSGMNLTGAAVIVPTSLQPLLIERIKDVPINLLASFLSYRANKRVAEKIVEMRSDIWNRFKWFSRPLKEDSDVELLAKLHSFRLLPEDHRVSFVNDVRAAAIDEADSSFLDNAEIKSVLLDEEVSDILEEVRLNFSDKISAHIDRVKKEWDGYGDPSDHFENLRESLKSFCMALGDSIDNAKISMSIKELVDSAVDEMIESHQMDSEHEMPSPQTPTKSDSLEEIFRDVND